MMSLFCYFFHFIRKYIWPLRMHDWVKIKCSALYTIWFSCLFRKCPLSVRFKGVDFLKGPDRIEMGENVCFSAHLYLTAWSEYSNSNDQSLIKIGNNCSIGAFNHITAINKIIIGDNFLSGKWVTISDNNHGTTSREDLQLPPLDRRVVSGGPVIIGKNVWVGDKVTILAGVTIGDGAVVAANTVVTKDVPPFCVCAGIPGKIIKQN